MEKRMVGMIIIAFVFVGTAHGSGQQIFVEAGKQESIGVGQQKSIGGVPQVTVKPPSQTPVKVKPALQTPVKVGPIIPPKVKTVPLVPAWGEKTEKLPKGPPGGWGTGWSMLPMMPPFNIPSKESFHANELTPKKIESASLQNMKEISLSLSKSRQYQDIMSKGGALMTNQMISLKFKGEDHRTFVVPVATSTGFVGLPGPKVEDEKPTEVAMKVVDPETGKYSYHYPSYYEVKTIDSFIFYSTLKKAKEMTLMRLLGDYEIEFTDMNTSERIILRITDEGLLISSKWFPPKIISPPFKFTGVSDCFVLIKDRFPSWAVNCASCFKSKALRITTCIACIIEAYNMFRDCKKAVKIQIK